MFISYYLFSANNRTFKIVIRINKDGGVLHSRGLQQEQMYRIFSVTIDSFHGSGVLELGYDSLGKTINSNVNQLIRS